MTPALVQQFALALGLGLIVGLEREHTHSPLAGIRTFPLITLLGCLSGLQAETYGPWLVLGTLAALVGVVVTGNLGLLRSDDPDPGLTTEIALLVMFLVGVLLAAQLTAVAVISAGVVAILLQGKRALHAFVSTLSEADLWVVTRFALIALVVLPLLPRRDYGPYGVLNPFEIWLMVVLIVGISLGAYVAGRLWGGRRGVLLTGLLGGLVSSTATTFSYARRGRAGSAHAAFIVIMSASAVVFARVLLEVGLVAPQSLGLVAPPLGVVMGFMALVSVVALRAGQGSEAAVVTGEAPEDFGAAVLFGLLYAVVLFAVAWARERVGTSGLYLVAALSGLVDLDAITLSTAQLVNDGHLAAASAWRVMLTGAMANLVFKGIIVAALGGRALLGRVSLGFALTLAVCAALLRFWP